MVDQLSLAKAKGTLEGYRGTPLWELYQRGRDAQIAIEKSLTEKLIEEGNGREQVLEEWMQPVSAHS